MNLSFIAVSGWVLAAALAAVSGGLLMKLRAEHVQSKTMVALGGTGSYLPEQPVDWDAQKKRVILVGDSRVAQWPLPDAPDGYHMVKRGRGGETSLQLLGRLPGLLDHLKPDVVVVGIGINDLVAASLSKSRGDHIESALLDNIDQMHGVMTRAGVAPVVSTIIQPTSPDILRRLLAWSPDIHSAVDRVNTGLLARTAQDWRIFDANKLLEGGTGPLPRRFSKDTLHLNQAAYARLSDALLQEITLQ